MDDPCAGNAAPSKPLPDSGSTAVSWKSRLAKHEKIFVFSIQVATLVTVITYTYFSCRQATIMQSQLHVFDKQAAVMQSQLNVVDKQSAIMQSQLYAQAGILAVTGFHHYPLLVGKMEKITFQIENPRPTPGGQ
jgi:cell division protein FtsL